MWSGSSILRHCDVFGRDTPAGVQFYRVEEAEKVHSLRLFLGKGVKNLKLALEHYQGRIDHNGVIGQEPVRANLPLYAKLAGSFSRRKPIGQPLDSRTKSDCPEVVVASQDPPIPALPLQAKIAAQMELAGELYDIQNLLRTELSTAEPSVQRLTKEQELEAKRIWQRTAGTLLQTVSRKQPALSQVLLSLSDLKSALGRLLDKWAAAPDTASQIEAIGVEVVFNVLLSRKLHEWLHGLETRYPYMKEVARRGQSRDIDRKPSNHEKTTKAEQSINSNSAASITDLTAPKDQFTVTKESESGIQSYTLFTTLPQTSQDKVRRSQTHDLDSSSTAESKSQEPSPLRGRDTQRPNSGVRDRARRRADDAKGNSTNSNIQHGNSTSDEADGLVDSPW